jgi:hypothetical protein
MRVGGQRGSRREALMGTRTIYVYLLDEGTDTWRPVEAEELESGRYRIVGPAAPEGETWEFPPGSIVRVEVKTLMEGVFPVACPVSVE